MTASIKHHRFCLPLSLFPVKSPVFTTYSHLTLLIAVKANMHVLACFTWEHMCRQRCKNSMRKMVQGKVNIKKVTAVENILRWKQMIQSDSKEKQL